MDKYSDFLAAQVLHENKVISYRALSRALKVHVDLAKQMLFDFHQKQTAKKPKCVHATYLITGRKLVRSSQASNGTSTQDGEDSFMQSSPYMSSAPEKEEVVEEPQSVLTIIMVQEESLEEVKSQFEEILSIQIYSLEPSDIKDLHILVNCNQEVASKYAEEDPLERWKTYGSIRNQNAKKRVLRKGGILPTAPVTTMKPTATKSAATTTKSETGNTTAPREHSGAHAAPVNNLKSKVNAPPKGDTKKPALSREKSDLFKSFAKSKPKKSIEKSKEPSPEAESVDQSAQEDEPMDDVSEGENEEEAAQKRKAAEEERRKKAAREEELRKMMDEDDDDDIMADIADAAEKDEQMGDVPAQPQEPEKKEDAVTVTNGRRRGRRRVMKKKTVKDEEGYLVTKEEAVWESFSEEEPAAKKPKPAPAAAAAAAAGGSTKAKKGKPGQGNIMNFFAKK